MNFKAFGSKEIMQYAKFAPLVLLGAFGNDIFFSVQPGEMAIKFNYFTGLKSHSYNEGYHLKFPFFEKAIIFQTQTRKISLSVNTQNRDLQETFISADVFYKPDTKYLHTIFRLLGPDYDKKVLDNILMEVIRGAVAQYNPQQLISERDQISNKMKVTIAQRAKYYNILIDGFTISGLHFSENYRRAVEEKQSAQQRAEQAKYEVEKATHLKKSIIIQSEAEAKGIELIGTQMKKNPAFIELQKIQFAVKLSEIYSLSRNKMLLNTDLLLLDMFKEFNETLNKE